MPQVHRLTRTKNTRIENNGLTWRLFLHKSEIVTAVLKTGYVAINTCGFNTATTRNRINQFLRQFGFEESLFLNKGKMFARCNGVNEELDTAIFVAATSKQVEQIFNFSFKKS